MPPVSLVPETEFSFPIAPTPSRDRIWLHALLFLLTVGTTTFAGWLFHLSYVSELGARTIDDSATGAWHGLVYSSGVLAILGAHEMGHYVAARYYRVDASLPYFLPDVFLLASCLLRLLLGTPLLPPLAGTFGAVIRLRSPLFTKRVLFDVGIAGPIAGFLVAVPVMVAGLMSSTIAAAPPSDGLAFGEPLLLKAGIWLAFGSPASGMTLNAHPLVFAAWFGLLATALNLFPIAQLDGGHIAYAAFGRRAVWLTYGGLGCCAALSLVSPSWIFFTLLVTLMLWRIGVHHPPVLDEDQPLDRRRRVLAICALVMLGLCFTPTPVVFP